MRITTRMMCVCLGLAGLLTAACQTMAQSNLSDNEVRTLWERYRQVSVNSKDFTIAQRKLARHIAALPEGRKVPVATLLMERGADDAINVTALQFFGTEGLPAAGLAKLMADPKRTWPQRVLLRTYYRFCRPENTTLLNETARRNMVGALATRLTQLVQAKTVDYGEQRLLIHMIQDCLARYAGQESIKQMAALNRAMQAYVNSGKKDPLAAAMSGWMEMKPKPALKTADDAFKALGHWDPLVRERAAAVLGSKIRRDKTIAQRVFVLLQDPKKGGDVRDEVRAAAASVFSFTLSFEPKKVVKEMVRLLVWDRGVVVQAAARGTLMVLADEAQFETDTLLDGLATRKPKPGPKRAMNMLLTLSHLVHSKTPTRQKSRLLNLAAAYLEFAPQGALRVFEALGEDAKPALDKIVAYRKTADRFTRQLIDRNVIPAIDPKYPIPQN